MLRYDLFTVGGLSKFLHLNWKSLATNLVKTQENGWQEVDRNNTSFGVKAWPTRPHDGIRAIGGQVMTCKVRVLKQVIFFVKW